VTHTSKDVRNIFYAGLAGKHLIDLRRGTRGAKSDGHSIKYIVVSFYVTTTCCVMQGLKNSPISKI